jgi:hypothetical protein
MLPVQTHVRHQVAKVDIRNAFNTINRSAIVEALVAAISPGLPGESMLVSSEGANRGSFVVQTYLG